MNSGTCAGGPLHGKRLHHPSERYMVAIDEHSGKTIPGLQAASAVHPDVKWGAYQFAGGIWTWHESTQSAEQKPVDSENR